MTQNETVKAIAKAVAKKGGRAYFVGGCVRDKLLGLAPSDLDIEVYGITPECLCELLGSFGEVLTYGRSFGIFSLKGAGLDIAMPRKEHAIGRGHTDFAVEVDPFIGIEKAASRRDFTVNAILRDVLTDEIIDPFNGVRDLENGILRYVNEKSFVEDPLRVLRGAQFAARFSLLPDKETVMLCRTVDLSPLAKERVFDELRKGLMLSEKPSRFFEVLREMNALSVWFPEVEALIGVPQNPVYHAEGDAYTHTMMVLDEAAKLKENTARPFPFMLSALCHDFGKAICTEEINGVLHSYEHELKGLPLVGRFITRLSDETDLRRYLCNMTELHMKPGYLTREAASYKTTNKLFDAALEPLDLIYLSIADNRGKIPACNIPIYEAMTKRLEHYKSVMAKPFVTGQDLLNAGLPAGKNYSACLAYARKLRLAEVEKENALKQTLQYAKTLEKKSKK